MEAPIIDRLTALMDAHPLLHNGGYGLPYFASQPEPAPGQTRAERRAQTIAEWRADLLSNADKVAWVEAWLVERIRPIKTPNRYYPTSYALKHVAETWHPSGYISNGTLIAAALLAGFTADLREYNPTFGFSRRDLGKLRRADNVRTTHWL